MSLIYIRHGHDNEKNPKRVHDPHLTEKGRKRTKKICKKIIKEHGFPTIILCSPFVRTRETLKIMEKIFDEKYSEYTRPKIIYDVKLSRFFTSDQQENPEILTDTKKYKVPIYETISDFIKRLKKHVREIKRMREREIQKTKKEHKSSPVIWCISHGLAIKKIVRFYGKRGYDHIEFLEYIKVL